MASALRSARPAKTMWRSRYKNWSFFDAAVAKSEDNVVRQKQRPGGGGGGGFERDREKALGTT